MVAKATRPIKLADKRLLNAYLLKSQIRQNEKIKIIKVDMKSF